MKGGSNGRCGYGGNGGHGGKKIIIIKQNSKTETSQNGDPGENGKPGKPGLGGLHGSSLRVKYEISGTLDFLSQVTSKTDGNIEKYESIQWIKSQERAAKGSENLDCLDKPTIIPRVSEIKFNERATEYLRFLIEMNSKFENSMLLVKSDFYKNLIENKYFEANIDDLIERVELFQKPEFHHLLEILKHAIQNYYNKSNLNKEKKLVLNYLLATISGMIIRQNIAQTTILESDLEKYLEDFIKDIQKWKEFRTNEIINKVKISRENSLRLEIEKATSIINNLEKYIQNSEKILNKNFDDSLKEILKLKNNLKAENRDLVLSKNDLQENLKLKKIFSGLKFASQLISVLGPKGAVIGSIMQVFVQFGSDLMINDKQEKEKNSKIEAIEQVLKDYEAYIEAKGEKKNKEKNKNQIEKMERSIEILSDFIELTDFSSEEVEVINEQIEKNELLFSFLYEIDTKINKLQTELWNEIRDELSLVTKSLNINSSVTLSFKKWKVKEILYDFQNEISILMNSLDHNKKQILSSVNRIQNTILNMIEIYSCILDLQKRIEDSNHMFEITRTSIRTGGNYENKFEALEKKIIENTIIERYEQALKSFSYWSFPFYCLFNITNIYKNSHLKSVDSFIDHYNQLANHMIEIVKRDGKLFEYDTYVVSRNFDKKSPYYQWTYKNYSNEIKDLLKGENVELFADAKESAYDAVKLITLNILIEIESSSEANETMNRLLENFEVELEHSGTSYYKFKNKVYEIKSNGKNLTLFFQYGSKSGEITNFKVFDKISKAKLSPFTSWQIRIQVNEENNENKETLLKEMTKLVKNHPDIKVSLIGKGTYVRKKLQISGDVMNCNN